MYMKHLDEFKLPYDNDYRKNYIVQKVELLYTKHD